MYQAIYDTSVVAKYPDTATIKENSNFRNNTLHHYIIFTKEYASTIDEQVEMFSREYRIHYRDCVVLLIYLFYTIVYLCFAAHKLKMFSSNPGKLHFEGLVHLLRYIRDNNNLGLRYYEKIEDAPLSDLLIKAIIKTESQLVVLSDFRW